MTNFVSIISTQTSCISNHTTNIDLPRFTKYRLFHKDNMKRKELTDCVDQTKWSLDLKEDQKIS